MGACEFGEPFHRQAKSLIISIQSHGVNWWKQAYSPTTLLMWQILMCTFKTFYRAPNCSKLVPSSYIIMIKYPNVFMYSRQHQIRVVLDNNLVVLEPIRIQ